MIRSHTHPYTSIPNTVFDITLFGGGDKGKHYSGLLYSKCKRTFGKRFNRLKPNLTADCDDISHIFYAQRERQTKEREREREREREKGERLLPKTIQKSIKNCLMFVQEWCFLSFLRAAAGKLLRQSLLLRF